MAKGVRLKDADGPVYPCPFFPVGAIYISTTSTNPSTYFGGTWEEIQGRFLLGRSASYAAGSQGGEASHKLTSNEMPSHNHTFSGSIGTAGIHKHDLKYSGFGAASGGTTVPKVNETSPTHNSFDAGSHTHSISGTIGATGGNLAHNNMPPYLAVYIWKRTA